MRYVLTIEVKTVDDGPDAARRGPVQEALRIVRATPDLRTAVEYAVQVLTLERNGLAQDTESGDTAWDRAVELFPKVRQRIYELGPRGITSVQVDQIACDLIQVMTGVALAVENGRVVS